MQIDKNKKLSIIFAADVYGYSRMMNENEERTLALLEKARKFIDPKLKSHGGRIANTAGDSIIAVFPTASSAIAFSIYIQKKLREANEKIEPRKRLILRIGIHIGEIYSRGEDVLGEGVNIAARLEGQAEPGAICMSEGIYNLVSKQLEKQNIKVANLGELELKNISTPIRGYEILSTKAGYKSALSARFSFKEKRNRIIIALVAAFFACALAVLIAIMASRSLLSISNI